MRRLPALMRGVGFRRYWIGQTISITGDQITGIALPLVAVLILHVRAAQMGVLTALVWLPSLLFAMSAGVLVDRRARRRVTMIAADVGRAAVMASIPIAYVFGVLTMWQLYVVAFCAGTLSVLFMVCDPAVFVGLVPEKQYVDGNSLLFGSRALASIVGPSAGGLLVQALTAPAAILFDAVSFLGSAFELSRIRTPEAPPIAAERGAFTAGMRFIRHSPVVGPSLASISVVNFFNFMFLTLNVLYATTYLHVVPGVLGLVFGAGAVGGLLGAAVTKRLAIQLGVGKVNLLGLIAFTAPLVLVPAAGGSRPVVLGMLFTAQFISGFGVMALDITAASIYATVVPNALRSRVSGAFQSVNYGTRPVGALVGGSLGAMVGVRTTLWIATIGGALGFLIMLPSGVPRYRIADDS
ncbi:MAG: MFS transporter [Actinocrinis sp.]